MKPELSVVGIDLAKSVLHLVGMDERGQIILRKRLARGEVLPFMAKLPRVLVGMEACGGALYWARQLREQGREVRCCRLWRSCRGCWSGWKRVAGRIIGRGNCASRGTR